MNAVLKPMSRDYVCLTFPKSTAERIREVLFACADPTLWAVFNNQMPGPMPAFKRAVLPASVRGVDPDGPDANTLLPRHYRQKATT